MRVKGRGYGVTVHVLWVCGKISFTKLPSQVQCPAQALLGRRHTFQVTGMQGGLVSQELAMQRAGDPCLVAFGVSPPFLAEIGPRLPPHLLNCVSGENPLAPSFHCQQCQQVPLFSALGVPPRARETNEVAGCRVTFCSLLATPLTHLLSVG